MSLGLQKYFRKHKASVFTISLRALVVLSILLLLGDSIPRLLKSGAHFVKKQETEATGERGVFMAEPSSDPLRTAWVTYLSGNDENYFRGTLSLYGSLRRHLEVFNDKFVVIVSVPYR